MREECALRALEIDGFVILRQRLDGSFVERLRSHYDAAILAAGGPGLIVAERPQRSQRAD